MTLESRTQAEAQARKVLDNAVALGAEQLVTACPCASTT